MKLRQEWREVIQTWEQNLSQFEQMTNEIEMRHATEIKALVDKLSGIVGINFRYVKISELPVPVKVIIDYNEQRVLNAPKTRMMAFIKGLFSRKQKKLPEDSDDSDNEAD